MVHWQWWWNGDGGGCGGPLVVAAVGVRAGGGVVWGAGGMVVGWSRMCSFAAAMIQIVLNTFQKYVPCDIG